MGLPLSLGQTCLGQVVFGCDLSCADCLQPILLSLSLCCIIRLFVLIAVQTS